MEGEATDFPVANSMPTARVSFIFEFQEFGADPSHWYDSCCTAHCVLGKFPSSAARITKHGTKSGTDWRETDDNPSPKADCPDTRAGHNVLRHSVGQRQSRRLHRTRSLCGWNLFSDDVELGNSTNPQKRPGDAFLLGGRAGYNLTERIGIEVETPCHKYRSPLHSTHARAGPKSGGFSLNFATACNHPEDAYRKIAFWPDRGRQAPR